ncbi:FAD-dependent urate hydroxylase HpxO [Spirulina sp. CS-785/01]|uniref:FAD-dependent urate hydroxylase HpxO n=1 Tax=Spirulina sp. CS-785/01 TaxID=3021716 RepID=UPI00232CF2E3|nr:FAD-dependent urate hydroxylase HpxO [Spirulina sp. CS-785/01]MDB9314533.1 FAD-dependent urate hydroxylase HpxO [Spirulina sp. CS-785/01]
MYGLTVIIIGAGIGGLTAGIALQQAGYSVQIFEKTQQLRPAGAGISLWSNGIKVLNRLGLGDQVAEIGGLMNRMEYRTHRDELLNGVPLQSLVEQVGQRPYPVARTDLQQMLLEAVGKEQVTLGATCVGVQQDEKSATAYFADGTTATGDLVIAADGIRSTIRDYVVGGSVTPRYAGYVNWNGLVEADLSFQDQNTWVIYVGEGKRASWMPVGGDRFYFFFGTRMPQGRNLYPDDLRQELGYYFQGWASPVQRLIQNLDPSQTNRLEIADLDPLDCWVRGRVVLLGDAAHASTPTLGQGGCQAMEDVEMLCRCLVTTNLSVEDALQRYEMARNARTASLTLKARNRTDTIYNKDPAQTQAWYEQLKQEKPEDVINAIAKIILGGPLG